MAQANIKAVITAEDRASGVLKGFGNAVESANDKIITGAKRAATALGLAATASAGFALKSAADFEQTRIGLENMLGSADKARVLLKDISKFAAETPFEFPELAQATRQLVAFGFSAEDAFDTMKQLGNVSAAVGAPINDLAYLMGTLRAQGRAFTIDIRQFAMRGIPIYEYLGKVLKADGEALQQMIEDGKVGFPEVQKAFELLAGEGGKWGDTMARQSKSVTGLFSTLKDVLGQTGRELIGITQEGDIKEGSVFALLRDAVAALIRNLPTLIDQMKEIIRDVIPQFKQWANNVREVAELIGGYLEPKFTALWHTLFEKVAPVLTRLWKEVLLPMIPVLGVLLVTAITAVVDGLNAFLSVAAPVTNWLLDNKPIALGLAAAFLTIQAAMGFGPIVAAFQASMAAINGSILATQGFLAGLNAALTGFAGFAAFAALAIAAVATVLNEFRKVQDALNKLDAAQSSLNNSENDAIRKLQAEATKARQAGNTARANQLAAQIRSLTADSDPGFRAMGGPVTGGSPYVVGERGPELFVPNGSGTIVPNHQMGGGSVNITVQAGAFMGSQQDARKYAKMIMDAYKDLMAGSGVMA